MKKLAEPAVLQWLSAGVAMPKPQFHQGTPTFRRMRPRAVWLRHLNLVALDAQLASEERTTRILSTLQAAA